MNSEVFAETYSGIDFKAAGLPAIEFEQCTFIDCLFSFCDLSNVKFIECTFNGCNLSPADLYNVIFRNVVFENSKLLGLPFSKCDAHGFQAVFKHCNLEMCDFSSRQMKHTEFHTCKLNNADFTSTNLQLSKFYNCDLSACKFDKTNLEKSDFTGSYNIIIDPILNKVKGAKIPAAELPGLLLPFGIEVLT